VQIDGSVALVTGAGRGLGRVYARELVSQGAARVYGTARDPAVTEPGVTPKVSPEWVARHVFDAVGAGPDRGARRRAVPVRQSIAVA
jgi:NAD(P)-dependent dehydrogenase (short-subunit alcohol dehydrogenase family)